jgi:hypothetical protein
MPTTPGRPLPGWAARLRAERTARGWSQADAVRALRAHAAGPLPCDATLLRNWKRWESAATFPDDFYRALLAKTLGTVTRSLFPEARARGLHTDVRSDPRTTTWELLSRLRMSDLSAATLDGLRITVDRLCSDYASTPAEALHAEAHAWLTRLTEVLHNRLTLAQHREVLDLAGWLALLVGCLEYDLGRHSRAHGTRRAAAALGHECGSDEIVGWAHELSAWFALTRGDYRGVLASSEAGGLAAPRSGVAVQLAGQAAKAWARVGDRRQVEVALDTGRDLLERLPYPADLDHHFVVDPAKFDFYAMDCYRVLGEDRLAETYAQEVIRGGTPRDGVPGAPMRVAEARITLGVVAARSGDLDLALSEGSAALEAARRSLPSLLMLSRELSGAVRSRSADFPRLHDFDARVADLTRTASPNTDTVP